MVYNCPGIRESPWEILRRRSPRSFLVPDSDPVRHHWSSVEFGGEFVLGAPPPPRSPLSLAELPQHSHAVVRRGLRDRRAALLGELAQRERRVPEAERRHLLELGREGREV